MMGPGEVFGLLIVVALPTLLLVYMARRFFSLREKQLEADTKLAAEKAAQYAASNTLLAERVRVLEEIVTDAGLRPLHRSRRCAASRGWQVESRLNEPV